MKTLVVYYSLEGNTKEAAEKIASSIGSDIMELVPVKDIPKKGLMKFIHGGSGATMGKGTELQPYTKDASSYDAIIVGTPVWAGKPCTALNQFLSDLSSTEKVIGAFAFAGGSADKCLSFLRAKYPSIKYTVSLADRNSKKLAPENGSKLSAFIEELKSELISN